MSRVFIGVGHGGSDSGAVGYIVEKDGVNLYRTYSDENYRIRQIETNTVYDEAIDVENAEYTYEETEEKIEIPEEMEEM